MTFRRSLDACPTCGLHPVVRYRRHQVLVVPSSGAPGRRRGVSDRPTHSLRVSWPVVKLRRGGPMRNASRLRDRPVCPDPWHGPLAERQKRWAGVAPDVEASPPVRPVRDEAAIEARRVARARIHRVRQGRDRR